jgi:hypothetical protein
LEQHNDNESIIIRSCSIKCCFFVSYNLSREEED